MTAPLSSSYRGWYFDRENSTLDVYFGTGGASDPAEIMRIDGTDINFNVNLVPFTTDGQSLGTSSLNWSDLFLDSGAVINFDSGNVTITHSAATLTVSATLVDITAANSGAVSSLILTNTSNDSSAGALIQVEVGGASASGDAIFNALETSGHTISLGIDTSANTGVLAMNAALGSADGDAIRITDATPPVITYNNAHPTGTFDYVCETCGAHGGEPFTCHGEPAPWHDDVLALEPALGSIMGQRLTGNEAGIQPLVRLGVMVVTPSDLPEEEGRNFVGINLQAAQWFTWSAMRQMYQRINDLEAKLAAVGA